MCINIGKAVVGYMRGRAPIDAFTVYDGEKVGPGVHEFHRLMVVVRVQKKNNYIHRVSGHANKLGLRSVWYS